MGEEENPRRISVPPEKDFRPIRTTEDDLRARNRQVGAAHA
jgi:hypothetical protein